jgi:hypothetical protein
LIVVAITELNFRSFERVLIYYHVAEFFFANQLLLGPDKIGLKYFRILLRICRVMTPNYVA